MLMLPFCSHEFNLYSRFISIDSIDFLSPLLFVRSLYRIGDRSTVTRNLFAMILLAARHSFGLRAFVFFFLFALWCSAWNEWNRNAWVTRHEPFLIKFYEPFSLPSFIIFWCHFGSQANIFCKCFFGNSIFDLSARNEKVKVIASNREECVLDNKVNVMSDTAPIYWEKHALDGRGEWRKNFTAKPTKPCSEKGAEAVLSDGMKSLLGCSRKRR